MTTCNYRGKLFENHHTHIRVLINALKVIRREAYPQSRSDDFTSGVIRGLPISLHFTPQTACNRLASQNLNFLSTFNLNDSQIKPIISLAQAALILFTGLFLKYIWPAFLCSRNMHRSATALCERVPSQPMIFQLEIFLL